MEKAEGTGLHLLVGDGGVRKMQLFYCAKRKSQIRLFLRANKGQINMKPKIK
jgi:hypothetical protein